MLSDISSNHTCMFPVLPDCVPITSGTTPPNFHDSRNNHHTHCYGLTTTIGTRRNGMGAKGARLSDFWFNSGKECALAGLLGSGCSCALVVSAVLFCHRLECGIELHKGVVCRTVSVVALEAVGGSVGTGLLRAIIEGKVCPLRREALFVFDRSGEAA